MDQVIEWFKANKTLSMIGAVLAVLVGTLIFQVTKPAAEAEETTFPLVETVTTATAPKNEASTESQATVQSSTVTIDLKGAVKKEGIYTLDKGSRVADAIEQAGGFTDQAERKSVNLAQKLKDEDVIYVATIGEELALATAASSATATGTTDTNSDTAKVNLNTADAAQLQTISGIGEKKAQDIIAYREANGGFKSVDDLGNVSGIGDKTLEKLREFVTVD
ncbi:helix-hairpin-helix domain-containing protein [Streptococcus caprae]|uniref:Helix-hairpin-helix domain-containing protein n=1 Tax=Streptococcus caprae TaxID=1640501 RepID=A0ABV8CZB7_9STRE